MIRMNWIRNNEGGFTGFQVRVSRAKLAGLVCERLLAHTRAIYCHEQASLALYRSLALNAPDARRRDLYLLLAEGEMRQLNRRAQMLRRLNAGIPGHCETRLGYLWRKLLVWSGPRYALAWVKRVKMGDLRRQLELMRLLKTLSGGR
jgi:hypothetical protein